MDSDTDEQSRQELIIFKYIKNLYPENCINETYKNKLIKHITNNPECLFANYTHYTPYIYAASINIDTLYELHSIYLELCHHFPSVYNLPFEYKNIDGYNLLHYILKMLIHNYSNPQLYKKYWNILHYILNNIEININSKNCKGNTVLHTAVEYDKIDLVKLFVFYKIKLNKRNYYGDTPLNITLKKSNYDIFKYLISKGCYHTLQQLNGEYKEFAQIVLKKKNT